MNDDLELSDKEFAKELGRIHKSLTSDGWIKKRHSYNKKTMYVIYEKNGYAIALEYGCKEDIT